MNFIPVKTIAALTSARLVTVSADALILDVAKLLSNTHISLVVVCDSQGAMVGVITKTNIVQQMALSCTTIDKTVANEVMVRHVISCRQTDSLVDILSLMEKTSFVHIPIVDEKLTPCGVVNAGDALRALMADKDYEAALLRNYVMGIGYR